MFPAPQIGLQRREVAWTACVEYQVTQRAAERLERALEADESAVAHLPEAARELLRRSVAGQLQELREQLAEYDAREADTPAGSTGRVTSAVASRSASQSARSSTPRRGTKA
jgi:hypothetical protein